MQERIRITLRLLWLALSPCGLCLAQAPPSPICASPIGLPPPGTNPSQEYLVQPQTVDFGQIPVGGSGQGQFCITTNNTAVFRASSNDSRTFPLLDGNQHPTSSFNFFVGLYALITVLFQPASGGQYNNIILLTANGASPSTVSLKGVGIPTLAITTPSSLPGGVVGQLYQLSLSATGGVLPYVWRLERSPPAGLVLNGNTLSGVPTQSGIFSLNIIAQDSSTQPLTANQSFTLVIAPAQSRPVILPTNGVVNGASFQPVISQSSWVSILGTGLAANTRLWTAQELAGGTLPLSLDNVSVTINGKNAFVEYISPTQINVVSPADDAIGPVEVKVINNGVVSDPVVAQMASLSPSFFLFLGKYVAALHADYVPVGSPNLIPGGQFRLARSGEILQLYASGLGPTIPAIPPNALTTVPADLITRPSVFFDDVSADILFAGLVPPYARLYQINARVPPATKSGDVRVVVSIGGASSSRIAGCCFITVADSGPANPTDAPRPIAPSSNTPIHFSQRDYSDSKPAPVENRLRHQ